MPPPRARGRRSPPSRGFVPSPPPATAAISDRPTRVGIREGDGMIRRMRRDTVPVLLVGVGVRGRMWARVLASEPGVQVVGYVDPDPAARAWVRETFGPDAFCFEDSADAMRAVDAALAVIATPPMDRLPLCAMLLGAGCDLLVEKPLTVDLAEAAVIA